MAFWRQFNEIPSTWIYLASRNIGHPNRCTPNSTPGDIYFRRHHSTTCRLKVAMTRCVESDEVIEIEPESSAETLLFRRLAGRPDANLSLFDSSRGFISLTMRFCKHPKGVCSAESSSASGMLYSMTHHHRLALCVAPVSPRSSESTVYGDTWGWGITSPVYCLFHMCNPSSEIYAIFSD